MNPELRRLPIAQRIQLLDDLWDSILVDQQALPLTDEQKAVLDLRLDAYLLDGNKGRPARDVLSDVRKRL